MAGEDYRELAAKYEALKDSITAYKVIVNEKLRRVSGEIGVLVSRVKALEEADEETEKSAVTDLRAKVAAHEAEKAAEVAKAREVRQQTVRNAMMLCIGGIITIGVSYLAHVLGLK